MNLLPDNLMNSETILDREYRTAVIMLAPCPTPQVGRLLWFVFQPQFYYVIILKGCHGLFFNYDFLALSHSVIVKKQHNGALGESWIAVWRSLLPFSVLSRLLTVKLIF